MPVYVALQQLNKAAAGILGVETIPLPVVSIGADTTEHGWHVPPTLKNGWVSGGTGHPKAVR
jgi:hypothetical protein